METAQKIIGRSIISLNIIHKFCRVVVMLSCAACCCDAFARTALISTRINGGSYSAFSRASFRVSAPLFKPKSESSSTESHVGALPRITSQGAGAMRGPPPLLRAPFRMLSTRSIDDPGHNIPSYTPRAPIYSNSSKPNDKRSDPSAGVAGKVQTGINKSHSDAPQSAEIEKILPSGLLAVYKPQDWTSFDVVAKIKRVLQQELQGKYGVNAKKLKVGHGGTLDPLATGVLVLGIGSGTKWMGDYLSGPKAYVAGAALGAETNTLDSTGKITGTAATDHVTAQMIESFMQKQFMGEINQIPPMFSALKQNGKRLYDLARKDVEVEREPRKVTVYDLKLLSFDESNDSASGNTAPQKGFTFFVSCSGGFYVRSLISDLGRACGSAAHMTSLERTKQGPFYVSECLRQENWTFDEIKKRLIEHNAISKFDEAGSKKK